jgi:hypothetical protein
VINSRRSPMWGRRMTLAGQVKSTFDRHRDQS